MADNVAEDSAMKSNGSNKAETREEKDLSYDPYRRILPLLAFPDKLPEGEDPYHHARHNWVKKGQGMNEWLILFYDLVVVAILTVFAAAHEIRTAHDIGVFLSYFCILWMVWFTQTIYDVRYGADDIWHRWAKLSELVAFTFLGAASGAWSPASIQLAGDPDATDAVKRYNASASFHVVVVNYAVLRGILLLQYLVVLYLAHRTRRPKQAIILPIAGLTLSLALVIVSINLNASTNALVISKVALLYFSMGVELVFEVVTASHRAYLRVPAERLHERLGALSLIILGEGFISVLKADNTALEGFSITDSNIYLLVFCTIAILFFLFTSMFASNPTLTGKRRSFIWAGLHFPLHFCILLLLAALVNTIIFRSYVDGTSTVTNSLVQYVVDIESGAWPPQSGQGYELTILLNKLTLDPQWTQQYENITATLERMGNPGPALLKYLGQVIKEAAGAYDLELSAESTAIYNELQRIDTNPFRFGNSSLANQTIQELGQKLYDFETAVASEVFIGTLWLFPCAGGALVLIAVISLVRHDFKSIDKSRFPLIEAVQFGAGTILALLGMLTIGQDFYSFTFTSSFTVIQEPTSPYLVIQGANWGIPLVLLIYVGTYWFTIVILRRKRHKERRGRVGHAQKAN